MVLKEYVCASSLYYGLYYAPVKKSHPFLLHFLKILGIDAALDSRIENNVNGLNLDFVFVCPYSMKFLYSLVSGMFKVMILLRGLTFQRISNSSLTVESD